MRRGVEHPVVNDADFKIWQSYAVKAWPTLALIDPQGKIVHTQSGEILAEEFTPKIETLIQEAEANHLLDRTPFELLPERLAEPLRPLKYPAKLLSGPNDTLFIADTGHHRILEVRLAGAGLSGEITRVFGSGRPGFKDGPAAEAMFHDPHGLALKASTLYVADTENHAVRAIDLSDGAVRTVAGTGQKAHGRFNLGKPAETPLRSPWAVLVLDEVVFIAMAGSHQIWALLQERQIGPFFGNGREALIDGDQMQSSFNQPSDLAFGLNHMFVADAEASAIRAIELAGKPRVITLVGQGLFEFGDIDGRGSTVRLQHPAGLTFHQGLVYIADSYNHKIKTLDPTTGEVKTLIGTGQPGHADGAFTQAQVFEPEGVAAGRDRLYIADTNNHLIRVADLRSEAVQTLVLHGLDRLAMPESSGEAEPAARLEPVTVGPGRVDLTLKLDLPAGYKLNADAPHRLQANYNGVSTEHPLTAGMATFPLDTTTTSDLDLALTLYYCETDDQRLCFIHQAHLLLPFLVAEDGPAQVEAVYRPLF